jgi:methylated-DNA-protein-cysteine methyltransferase-like protein
MTTTRDYFGEVYDVVRLVPRGRVTTYGAIARYLSLRAGARMVGWAMNASHGQNVPAHRVINSQGVLSGKHFFGGPTIMEQLLADEGIKVVDDRVVDFKTVFWDPSEELSL